jgi:hypothetical protein
MELTSELPRDEEYDGPYQIPNTVYELIEELMPVPKGSLQQQRIATRKPNCALKEEGGMVSSEADRSRRRNPPTHRDSRS